jgi:DNA polymerase III subunit epsilon
MFSKDKRPYEYPVVAIDIETSGAYPLSSEICEIAAVKYQDGKIIDTFQSLVKVTKPMSDFIIGIHGITNEMVADAPTIGEVLPKFLAFITDSIIIGHHVQFDLGFIAIEIEKHNLKYPNNLILCTSLLSRNLIMESPNHKLQTLIQFLKLDQGTAHRALDDAKACLEVFHRSLLRVESDSKYSEIEEIQEKTIQWETFSMQKSVNTQISTYLYEAIKNNRPVEINYQTSNVKTNYYREIHPKGLVLNPDQHYVIAHCMQELRDKRFYLNKILDVRAVSTYLS